MIRVLVVDDHRLFAEGLMSLLGADDRIDVVGHASNGAQAVELAADLAPDLVLMDVQLPVMDGIEATRRIKEMAPGTPVLMLSASTGDELQRAAEAGAAGYLTKAAASSELVAAIVEIAAIAGVRRTHNGSTPLRLHQA